MTESTERPLSLTFHRDHWRGRFNAMGSPCEVLLEARDPLTARERAAIAAEEAWRVEDKFSRYRSDGIVHAINTSAGRPVVVDTETSKLLDFADRAYALSDGLFDITCGILRAAWTFDGGDGVPAPEALTPLLKRINWSRVLRRGLEVTLPAGMEIDLGGIGKEYAVDRAASLLAAASPSGIVMNFGGDIAVTGPRESGRPWRVGLEASGGVEDISSAFDVHRGGIATSGDLRRFVQKDGVRYGHILNPKTGFPELGAPAAVTVIADSCTEAGFMATLAMLKGAGAESFLEGEGVRFRCRR